MLKAPTPFLNDEGLDDLADLDGWPGGGLCCPDDPLDDVMGCYLPVLDDDGFMAALGIGGCPADGRRHEDGELKDVLSAPPLLDAAVSAPGGVPGEDFDVDMFFADDGGGAASNTMYSCHAAVTSALPAARVLADPCGALDGVAPYPAPPQPAHDALDRVAPVSAPPLPTHDALDGVAAPVSAPSLPAHDVFDSVALVSAPPTTTSSTSSGCVSSMTTWEPDSPPRVSPLLPACWVVPRKKRHRPVTRRNHFWLSKSQLDAEAPPTRATPPPTSLKTGGNNGAGGGASRQQRPIVARQRNRQKQRACSHCSNTETPQWRAGPRGPGTLCNACGICFKQNGKLFEAYRPSTSPSFESGKYSNRQRKVVKLMERKQQELMKLMADTVSAPPIGGSEF